MKELFRPYYKLEQAEFEKLWQNAIFVFDTNVLLNLYRYQSSTRDALLAVMEKLNGRAWIPYHVGLEFQRNRLKVIADQHKRFSDVRQVVNSSISGMRNKLDELQLKKRHSHINPDKLIEGLTGVESDFLTELKTLEEQSISVNSEDKIRERIDTLFKDAIGPPPIEQKAIDELVSEGESRYAKNIPPGYEDSGKGENAIDTFLFGGIEYRRKFGDLIVWKQIIDHARKNQVKDIIFVTDDNKSDWWWKIKSNGTKTIGVRPELKDEIHREAEVNNFHLYNTESFLSHANQQLDAKVTEEAIEEVRDMSDARRELVDRQRTRRLLSVSAENAVVDWLSTLFSSFEPQQRGRSSFDIVAYRANQKHGFEVMLVTESRSIVYRLRENIYRSYYLLKEENFHKVSIVLVVLDEDHLRELDRRIQRLTQEIQVEIEIVIGLAETNEEEDHIYLFRPYREYDLQRP